MIPLILAVVGGYLIGDSMKSQIYAKGGMAKGSDSSEKIKKRLEQLRKELRAERISYGELAELQSLSKYIDKNDIELLEAAGVPEHDEFAKGGKVKVYKLGDMWSDDFDYDGMLKTALKSETSWGIPKLQKLYYSLEDVNYHRANSKLGDTIDALKKKMPNIAEISIIEFHNAIEQEIARNG